MGENNKATRKRKVKLGAICLLIIFIILIAIISFGYYMERSLENWDWGGKQYTTLGDLEVVFDGNVSNFDLIKLKDNLNNENYTFEYEILEEEVVDYYFEIWEKNDEYHIPSLKFHKYNDSHLFPLIPEDHYYLFNGYGIDDYIQYPTFWVIINSIEKEGEIEDAEETYVFVNDIASILNVTIEWDTAIWDYQWMTMTSEGTDYYYGYPPKPDEDRINSYPYEM